MEREFSLTPASKLGGVYFYHNSDVTFKLPWPIFIVTFLGTLIALVVCLLRVFVCCMSHLHCVSCIDQVVLFGATVSALNEKFVLP